MSATGAVTWNEFLKRYMWFESIGMGLDFSRTTMPLDFAEQKREMVERALREMRDLEAGAIANPDENRMVGHYWLRNPDLAPTPEIRAAINQAIVDVKACAAEVHAGRLRGASGPFKRLLLIGIGGSALGPQFVSHALSDPRHDKMEIYFLDNTDPDGFDRVFARLDQHWGETLCIVISKSGGTKETRNGMLETEVMYRARGLEFSRHAIAVTSDGSELHRYAGNWLKRFPMWDWVGGRTSELSAVGLLPAALQGFDIDRMLEGAREADIVSRNPKVNGNPAIQLGLLWFYIGNGIGSKAMVVLPYKDRLELFSKYLQQLVMESLGKRHDRNGREVNQGLTVYGNKGSTDQHAYVQQLRDGIPNFFCILISVLQDRSGKSLEVEPQINSGDYLYGFLLGTRDALFEMNRESATLTLRAVDPFTIGAVIAIFERAVGYYAAFININAYNQPGVEAGKKAAAAVIRVERDVIRLLGENPRRFGVADIAQAIGGSEDWVFYTCQRLCVNNRVAGVEIHRPDKAEFWI